VFYAGSYLLTVYSKGLYDNQAAVGGLGTIVVLFIIFTSVNLLNQLQAKQKNDLKETLFQVEKAQLNRQLNFLAQSRAQMTIYRHDMRHHFNIIDAYLQGNDLAATRDYIKNLKSAVDATKLVRYSPNDTLNLILSAWHDRAAAEGINVLYKIGLDNLQGLDETELFLLLDNALENAINGAKLCQAGARTLSLRLENREDKLLLEIKNSCIPGIIFNNNLPVSDKPGHGQGVHSIVSLVKKHQGIYSFSCADGIFTLRVRI
jgi:sensor histidine kinase regulating citrate/malate metabolism